MKQTLAFSFLLVATIILLAHDIVPHHNHENVAICFFDSHSKDSNESRNEHHDSPTDPFSEKCCFIDTVYTHSGNNIKSSCRLHAKCDCGRELIALVSYNLHTPDFVGLTVIHFRQNPFIPLLYSEFISQSKGLRAPPLFS